MRLSKLKARELVSTTLQLDKIYKIALLWMFSKICFGIMWIFIHSLIHALTWDWVISLKSAKRTRLFIIKLFLEYGLSRLHTNWDGCNKCFFFTMNKNNTYVLELWNQFEFNQFESLSESVNTSSKKKQIEIDANRHSFLKLKKHTQSPIAVEHILSLNINTLGFFAGILRNQTNDILLYIIRLINWLQRVRQLRESPIICMPLI